MNISRFVENEKRELELEFITPAFLGNANQDAELRPAPFKGMLRYWWRILYGAKYGDNIASQESKLFGSTEGASAVRLCVYQTEAIRINNEDSPFRKKGGNYQVSHAGGTFSLNILDYLAYGKYEYQREVKRNVYKNSHIEPGVKFKLRVECSKDYASEVFTSLYALVEFGGIGSRCRNGFGSLGLVSGKLDYAAELKKCAQTGKQKYSALSKESRLYQTAKSYPSWDKALAEVGLVYKDVRIGLEGSHLFNRRGLVSRPIVARGEYIPVEIRSGRRPKFVFLHVNKVSDGYVGRILTLPIYDGEEEETEAYNGVVNDFHAGLDRKLQNITDTVLGGKK